MSSPPNAQHLCQSSPCGCRLLCNGLIHGGQAHGLAHPACEPALERSAAVLQCGDPHARAVLHKIQAAARMQAQRFAQRQRNGDLAFARNRGDAPTGLLYLRRSPLLPPRLGPPNFEHPHAA